MKKVVRLTETDLNRLVRRIISETPFDDSRVEKFNFDLNPDPSDEEIDRVSNDYKDTRKTYNDFTQNGIPMQENDVEFLMMIAREYTKDRINSWALPKLEKIEKRLEDIHYKNFSKRNKSY